MESLWNKLQGHYGRTLESMQNAGFIKKHENHPHASGKSLLEHARFGNDNPNVVKKVNKAIDKMKGAKGLVPPSKKPYADENE